MATKTAAIAPAAPPAEIAQSKDYQELCEGCRRIVDSGRVSALHHYWELGKLIEGWLGNGRQEYGEKVTEALAADLAIDRTNVVRARQLYHRLSAKQIGDARHLSWQMARMMLPLDDPYFGHLLARIQEGELRTDDAVRKAIIALRQELGDLAAPLVDESDLINIPGLKRVTAEGLAKLWRHALPDQRCLILANVFIPRLELEKLDRPDALQHLRDLRRQIDKAEKKLNREAE